MTEKFTPGRYRRAFNRSRNGKTVRGLSHCRIENEKGVVIAFTVPQKSRQEQIANTNLLAAAPEMYWMLKYLADGVRWGGLQHTDKSLAAEIENLLKKARGEE